MVHHKGTTVGGERAWEREGREERLKKKEREGGGVRGGERREEKRKGEGEMKLLRQNLMSKDYHLFLSFRCFVPRSTNP